MNRHQVVIIGGGFAGLNVARRLRRARADITVIDRQNYHLFQPLLYQVATGGLSPANIASPIRSILKRQRNTQVVMGKVTGIDTIKQAVELEDGQRFPYDTLVVATGARHHYFGNEHYEVFAPGLKSIGDATEIRRRILTAFEEAEAGDGPDRLTFVVVGAGPTGLELSGTIAELARQTLPKEFRKVDTRKARVLLVEGQSRVLPTYPEDLSAKAQRQLEDIGVEVRTHTKLTDLSEACVELTTSAPASGPTAKDHEADLGAEERVERLEFANVFWAAGVKASSLGRSLAEGGAELDGAGRVVVSKDCTLPNHPKVFVLGDLAHFEDERYDHPLPGTAAVASQQGKHVGKQIVRRLQGKTIKPFRYRDLGQMATIGRAAAVADLGKLHFGGYFAWLTWLFLHLMLLVGFQNRVLVFMQWCWNYTTRNRSARLIEDYGWEEQLADSSTSETSDSTVEA